MPRRLPPFFLRLRFATSFIATWLLNLNVFGFSLKSVCSPGFNCHGCPWATAACPIGVMAYGSAMHAIPLFAIASILAVGAVLGRLVCSFFCPFGLLQDLLHRIPSPKIRLPQFFQYGKYVALILLVFLLPYFVGFAQSGYLAVKKPELNSAAGGEITVKAAVQNLGPAPVIGPQLTIAYRDNQTKAETDKQVKSFPDVIVPPGETVELPTFTFPNRLAFAELVLDSPQSVVDQRPRYQLYYCKLCPAGTLTSTIPLYFTRPSARPWYKRILGDWLRQSILLAFLVLMVIASRPFCRVFCPLGAIYGLTARLSVSRLALNPDACINCGQCDKACPMDLDVRKQVGGADCIACGDCIKVCPERGIRRRFGM